MLLSYHFLVKQGDVCCTLDDLSHRSTHQSHEKDGVPCHYMTDHEADMKQNIHKLHNPALKDKLGTKNCVRENAWLDLTSSWSIKDIEKRFKTFLENHTGSTMRLVIQVIINHEAEEPRSKTNAFRVPPYASPG